MAKRNYRNVAEWIKENTGKHFCQCGCNRLIEITKNHSHNGIPKCLVGHGGRKRVPKIGYLSKEEKEEWITNNRGKHLCRCGCGKPVTIDEQRILLGIPKFVSGHNAGLREYPNEKERFWEKVNVLPEGGCWEWTGCTDPIGYGKFRTRNRAAKRLAHRFSYMIHHDNVLPEEIDVLHKCDNRKCVNPEHLFVGTHAENMYDAWKKGKFDKTLNAEKAVEIVKKVKSGRMRSKVAVEYGVSRTTITAIMNGTNWRHATGIVSMKRR